jgi:hypothetical protein
LAGDENHICFRRVEAGGENGVVAKHSDLATLKTVQEVAARGGGGFPADGCRWDAFQVQPRCDFLGMPY